MTPRPLLFVAIALALGSMLAPPVVGEADAAGRRASARYRKLDTGERVRAIEQARAAATPALSRRAARAVGASFRSEVLLVERHRYAKGEDDSRRLADVYIYDYEQDQLCRAVVDLDTDAVESITVAGGVQLPLTEAEVGRALRLALDHPEFGARLRNDYQLVTGQALAAPDDLDVSGFAYRADSMRDGDTRESRICGKRRCAQLMLRTPDGTVLDLPIVDLSRNRLLDSRAFGLNARERLRRRRELDEERRRTGGGHHHEDGGHHAH